MIKVVSVGDIMPGGLLHGTDKRCVSEELQSLLNEGDVRVGTLECSIGNEPDFVEEKMSRYGDVIYAQDDDLKRLVEMNINIVSLANNHFFDLKTSGAQHTIEMLDRLSILHCGAGNNIKEAQKPSVLSIGGKRIAFLAFCDYHKYMGWIPFATEDDAGVNPMYDDYVIDEIKKNKKEYDYVVVLPHWGREHTFETTIWCYQMAKRMVKAGADLILGSHPHRVQPVINWRNKSIVYSMGNFLFPERLIAPPLRSTFYPSEWIDITKLPATDRYPAVEAVTYKKWKPLAKFGMVVLSSIEGNKTTSQYYISHLEDDNTLVIKSDYEIDKGLKKYSFWLNYLPYDIIIRIRNKFDSLISKLKRK